MTKPDWIAKLQDAVLKESRNGTEEGQFAQANADSVVDTIKGCGPDSSTIDPDFGARMVCNISSVHIPAFVTASLAGEKAYKNGYDLAKYRIGGSASDGSLKTRDIVDQALTHLVGVSGDKIYFGAVELNGAGVRFYGDICLVLKRDAVLSTTTILDRNSYDLVRSPLRQRIESGNPAMWDKKSRGGGVFYFRKLGGRSPVHCGPESTKGIQYWQSAYNDRANFERAPKGRGLHRGPARWFLFSARFAGGSDQRF
jgi:hypothetical protein